jgi:hypothetical protein
MKKIEFETFKDLENTYTINQLKKEEPCNINFLEYRKYKVTIELVEEPKEVLIERLERLRKESRGFDKNKRLNKEIELISKKDIK